MWGGHLYSYRDKNLSIGDSERQRLLSFVGNMVAPGPLCSDTL